MEHTATTRMDAPEQQQPGPGKRSSRRRAALIGAIFGAVFGAIFFTMYSLAAAYLCIGNANCPSSWAPYAVVAASGTLATTGAGAAGGVIVRGLYRLMSVD